MVRDVEKDFINYALLSHQTKQILYSCTHLTSAANFCTYPERNLLDCLGRVNYPREGVMHLE